MRRWMLLGVMVASFGIEQEAHASGYLTARFGSDHGTPALSNPYAVYFNPAAIGGSSGTQLTLDGTLALRTVTYQRPASALSPRAGDPNDPSYVAANTGTGRIVNVLGFPFFGATTDLGIKRSPVHLGFASYIPFGGVASWDRFKRFEGSDTPAAVDGVNRWHSISGLLMSWYNTMAAAVSFGGFSVGASFSVIFHEVKSLRARTVDGSDDVRGADGSFKEGRSLLEAHQIGFGAALGVHYTDPAKKFQIGLSYTSQPNFGEMRLRGELTTIYGNEKSSSVDKVDFLQSYPDLVRLGVAFKVDDKWEIRADGEYVRWSVMDKQCLVREKAECPINPDGSQPTGANVLLNIPRNWNNTVAFRAGPAYWLTESTEVFGSLGFATPAAPKTTLDAATIDSQRLNFAVGMRHEFSKRFALAVSYNHVYFLPVDTEGVSIHYRQKSPSLSPSADGRYTSNIFFLNANATVSF